MTTAGQAQQAAELVKVALELPEGERAAYLERTCAGDAALREEVESLLRFAPRAEDFIEDGALRLAAKNMTAAAVLPGVRQIEGYEILSHIGSGGMGEVYLAHDTKLHRDVALKLVRMESVGMAARFGHEERILASLNHPNIAQLYDAGIADGETPFFAMEYIDGVRLDEYCKARALPIRARLELFRKVCAAVHYAHQRLVIHRDLKPSNILVTADGEPKLLDFGIAKIIDPQDADTAQTMTLKNVMTPDYASPEQVRGEAMTTASDVYSLGVILYELLTGQRPYRLTSRRPNEVAAAIADQEPQRPSTAVRDDEQRPGPANGKSLRGDLDNIVLMALRKEPARRYASVGQFSADIERHLEGRPVLAHTDTLAYRATKFIKRNRIGVAAALLVLLTLVAGIVATALQAQNAMRQARIAAEERDRARRSATKADRLNTFLQNILGFSDPTWLSANPKRNREATIADALDEAGRRAVAELADEPEVLAAVHFTIGWTYKAQAKFAAAEPHLRASLELRQRVLGREHPDTAQSLVGIGEFHHYKSQYSEAEVPYSEAVDIYRKAKLAGKTVDAMWFAIALNNLGAAKLGLGKFTEAEPLFQEGLKIGRAFTGNKRAPVAVMLSHLGLVRREQGDLAGAVEYMERGLQEYRSLPGEPRFEMGAAMFNLATTLTWVEEYDRAEVLAREAFDVIRNGVGETHPYTPRPLIALSTIHYRRGDYAKAREEIDRALQLQLAGMPEEHLDLAMSRIVLGKIQTHTGDPAGGEATLRRALEVRMRALPSGHHMIADAQGALGECLAVQRRFEEAEQHLVAAYEVLRSRLGEKDPRSVEVAQQLAGLRTTRSNGMAEP